MNEPPNVSVVEEVIVYCFTVLLDGAKFITGLIPVVDLLGGGVAIAGGFLLSAYLFLRLGPTTLFGGEKSGQKMLFFFTDAVVSVIPEIDDLLPTLTPLAWNSFRYAKEEHKKYLAKKAALAKVRGARPARPANSYPALNDNEEEELSQAA